jgi:hypothetical protein
MDGPLDIVLENPDDFPVEILDVQPDLRHLLLLVRGQADRRQKDLRRFLRGHDERHWFVAAITDFFVFSIFLD